MKVENVSPYPIFIYITTMPFVGYRIYGHYPHDKKTPLVFACGELNDKKVIISSSLPAVVKRFEYAVYEGCSINCDKLVYNGVGHAWENSAVLPVYSLDGAKFTVIDRVR